MLILIPDDERAVLIFCGFSEVIHVEDMNMVVVAQLVMLVGDVAKVCIMAEYLKTFAVFNMDYT